MELGLSGRRALVLVSTSRLGLAVARMLAALSNIARAGLAGYLKTLAGEVARDGVTVNMVLPGRISTDRVAALDRGRAEREGVDVADVEARSRAGIPVGRYGEPEEFAAVAVFLCGAGASYVTGEQVRCDGGLVGAY